MPGTVLIYVNVLILTSQQPRKVDSLLTSPLQVRKQRLREVSQPAQGHRASEWQSQDGNPGVLDFRALSP